MGKRSAAEHLGLDLLGDLPVSDLLGEVWE